jgi:(E)-4-hydroxy-3-methylbut-2-enyl-diphosphate synthase
MTNTSTNDIEGSVAQICRIIDRGGEIVRLTTQGVREAESLGLIRQELERRGITTPLVADVHFNPKAALKAATTAHKVRINPGNFTDAARTFRHLEFTDEEYAAELDKIRRSMKPLIDLCKEHNTALRLGVNHGSLSDRIMSRYGDTPAGMTESVMEYLRVCREEAFYNIVISIKASNPVVMTQTVRMLAAEMEKEDMHFPLHLGVTEAGGGEDGRIKSAVGIGCLLAEGIGDTIRVSLSEAPENEIPVAAMLRDYICSREGHATIEEPQHPIEGSERDLALPLWGYDAKGPAVIGVDFPAIPESWHRVEASQEPQLFGDDLPVVVSSTHSNPVGEMASYIDRFRLLGAKNPVVLRLSYADSDAELVTVKAGADLGFLLLNGYGSAVCLEAPCMDEDRRNNLVLAILQACRLRVYKTDYIACPSCGRTLFDLEATLEEVKRATAHLTGLKIGVMGCIVNGPGEMADADYGYVGAAPGRVSIYKNKNLIRKNIPTAEALPALIEIIKENGDWRER